MDKTLKKYFSELGKKGNKARNEKLTPAERTAIAKKAVEARIAKKKKKKGKNEICNRSYRPVAGVTSDGARDQACSHHRAVPR